MTRLSLTGESLSRVNAQTHTLPVVPERPDDSLLRIVDGQGEATLEISADPVAAIDDANPETDQLALTDRPRARLTRLSDVIPCEVSWLWKGVLAIGKMTVIIGDPGVGKSFLSLDLAARASTGKAWPDGSSPGREPVSVILISAEDDASDTIRPRLGAAGADMERIVLFDKPEDADGKSEWFNLRKHIGHLEWAVRQRSDTKLIVIDPVTAFGGGVDQYGQGAVREMLQPLVDMAARLGVAVAVISHPNKSEGGKAAYRTTGSLAYNAVARIVFFVVKDASDSERRLLLPVKDNLANDSKGFAFRIEDGKMGWDPDPIFISADDALAAEAKARQRPSELDRAVVFLRDLLEAGAMSKNQVLERGQSSGFAEKTLERAKKEASIGDKRFKTDLGTRSFWHLAGRKPTALDECQLEESETGPEEVFQDLQARALRTIDTAQEETDLGFDSEDDAIPI